MWYLQVKYLNKVDGAPLCFTVGFWDILGRQSRATYSRRCGNPVSHSHISTYVDYGQSGLSLHNNNIKDDNNNKNKLRKKVFNNIKFWAFLTVVTARIVPSVCYNDSLAGSEYNGRRLESLKRRRLHKPPAFFKWPQYRAEIKNDVGQCICFVARVQGVM